MLLKVSIIIPAFNESKNISQVLEPIQSLRDDYEILVVNDGSEDNTSEVVRSFDISIIDLTENRGKSYAMWTGLKHTKGHIVLFLDADLIGLKPVHIENLVAPVVKDMADMTVGIFYSGRNITDLVQKLMPFLSGQRCVKREILDKLDSKEWFSGFGIEVALTRYAKEHKLRIQEVPLFNVTHSLKEEKMGLTKGMKARLKMYWEITKEIKKV